MSDNTIYLIFGGAFMLFLVMWLSARSKSRERKSRKFMGDYKRDKKKE